MTDYNTFDSVCSYLSSLTAKGNNKDTRSIIHDWFSHLPRPTNTSSDTTLYTILKFLLPDYDTRMYKIKHFTLAKLISQTYGLNKADTNTLMNWNKPNAYQVSNNFGLLAYNICRKVAPSTKNDITIQQVDMWLTLLTEDVNFIKTILPQLSSIQLLWFCNIVLKQVKIGTVMVLSAYHPDAPAYWNTNRNLEDLCTTLVDPKKRYDVYSIKWGNNFNPMLCESITYDKFVCDTTKPVYVETKLDGERMMLHYRRGFTPSVGENSDDEEYICYTRNGKNYTKFYKSLQPYFKQALVNFEDCIIDGEVVLIDKQTGEIAPKANMYNGTNKDDYNMRYIVFDVIYSNGQSIAMLPLSKRISHVAKIVRNDFVQISDIKMCSNRQDVLTLFTRSIETHQEGIVIKYEDTSYQVGARKKTLWLKMKPDYEDAIADDLDLVILGGYYAEGSSTTKAITSFLVGYLDKQSGQFKSLTSVGNGFTQDMYTRVLKKLNESTTTTWKYAKMMNIILGEHKPDVLYNPMKSVIVQIRAASVTESSSTGSGMNLRFPRCTQLRFDKKPTETTTPCLSSMKEKRVVADKPEVPIWETGIWHQKFLIDPKEIIQQDYLFKDLTFFISTKTPQKKQELETVICQHGGQVMQNGCGVSYIVSDQDITATLQPYVIRDRVMKLGNKKVELKEHNIVKAEWVDECIQYGEVRAMNDENSYHAREDLFLQGSTFYFPVSGGNSDRVKIHGGNVTTDLAKATIVIVNTMKDADDAMYDSVRLNVKFHTKDWLDQQFELHKYETYERKVIPPPQKKRVIFIDSNLDMNVWKQKLVGDTVVTTFDSPITHVLVSQKPTAISFGKVNKLALYNELRKRRPNFKYILTSELK